MALLHGGSGAGRSDFRFGHSLDVVGRSGLHQSGLVSIYSAGCFSPGPRKNDLTIYWALRPFVGSFTLLVDPGDIYPPQLPHTPDMKGYWQVLTQAANHLLPLAHPLNDLRNTINIRRDVRSNINASRARQHENEMRRQEEYDQDHGAPACSRATRTESTKASTSNPASGQSRRHDARLPPQDHRHDHRREDRGACGVSSLTPSTLSNLVAPKLQSLQLRQVRTQAGPERLVGSLNEHRPGCWAIEYFMKAYLPIILGQDALQCFGIYRGIASTTRKTTAISLREFPIPLQQTGATMGPQIHQAPERRDPPLVPQAIPNNEEPLPEVVEAVVIEDFY
jgi:hypothetical protein